MIKYILIVTLFLSGCTQTKYVNVRPVFHAHEPTRETAEWILKNKVPDHVIQDVKLCKLTAKTVNRLNNKASPVERTFNSTWAWIIGGVALGSGWVIGKVKGIFSIFQKVT